MAKDDKKERIISRAATQKPPEYPLNPETITGGVMPMEIAGRFQEERARLGPDFNEAERKWRVRWNADQNLDHHEPLPESDALKREKYWLLRRIYRRPMDILEERVLIPKLGPDFGGALRKLIPKSIFMYLGVLVGLYHLKYLSGSWEVFKRPILYFGKPALYPGDEGYPLKDDKTPAEWFDNGFSKRNAHLNLHDPNRFKI